MYRESFRRLNAETIAVFFACVAAIAFPCVTAAWDISTITYDNKSALVSSQDGTPFEVAFKTDGTKMYILGFDNDRVYQYSLSSAWDVSTATYDSVSFSVASQESSPEGMYFKPDGSKMYVIGVSGDRAYQYALGTPWDLSTASYESKSSPSNGSRDATTVKVAFKPDGSKMYLLGFINGRVYSFSLSSAWDVSTATYDNVSFSMFAQTSNPYAFTFSPDGLSMFGVGSADVVYQYDLASAWDISTASYASKSINLNSRDSELYGITFRDSSGSKLYFSGANNNRIFQYSVDVIDVAAPTVQTLSPSNGGVNFSPTGNLVITFNESVATSTGNLTIKKSFDDSIVETFAANSPRITRSGATVTIDPTASLDSSTGYYVLIDSGLFEDTSGNDYTGISTSGGWNFSTADAVAPSMQSLSPLDDATDVATTTNLVITFSENVSTSSAKNLVIKKTSDDTTVETIASDSSKLTISGATATVNPSTILATSTGYYVQIDSGMFKDSSNNTHAGIADSTTWNFTTAAGPTTPQVTTGSASSIARTSVNVAGTVDDTGSLTVTTAGFEYDTDSGAPYASSASFGGTFTGAFDYDLSSLTCGSTYYYRALATNSMGTGYGSEQMFTTSACADPAPTVTAGGGSMILRTPILENFRPVTVVEDGRTFVLNTDGSRTEISANDTPAAVSGWSRDLFRGSSGEDVRALQRFLNSEGFLVAESGAGSIGQETTIFGRLTERALARFQASRGIVPAAGYFGPKTRAAIDS